ncbi:hypothetical protein SLEP1_g14113 [Rubroshorea leprosula]|uniref:Reverse transcriptase Ty1/copia-type domain-containing protein n=1 Tax=Rubroshorea leprosula TaxID=152421 RepID=A0AAV5IHX4_9ROSI|nr:hypothetical protein SLEP1_g14113 [Rubroshorea leprosula]
MGYNIEVSPSHQTPIFTNTPLELFPSDDAGFPDELSNNQTIMALISKDVSFVDTTPRTNEIENSPIASSSSHPTWVRNPPTYLQDYHCLSTFTSLHEPQQAMKEELQALEKTSTLDLVDLPTDKTLVGCKWVYKIKTHSDGSVEHYKAHLMAKCFTQEYDINYEETFAPVAYLITVCSLLAIVAVRKWNSIVSEFSFTSSPHDTTLFVRKSAQGMVLVLIYVDDVIITGDDVSGIDELKQFLSHIFEMKDLGSLSYFFRT